MRVFLSRVSYDLEIAEEIRIALIGAGHDVFLRTKSIPAGDDYVAQIRHVIKNTDYMVFLISPASVYPWGYTLSELIAAMDKWLNPSD
jgi:hypothetical protein